MFTVTPKLKKKARVRDNEFFVGTLLTWNHQPSIQVSNHSFLEVFYGLLKINCDRNCLLANDKILRIAPKIFI